MRNIGRRFLQNCHYITGVRRESCLRLTVPLGRHIFGLLPEVLPGRLDLPLLLLAQPKLELLLPGQLQLLPGPLLQPQLQHLGAVQGQVGGLGEDDLEVRNN